MRTQLTNVRAYCIRPLFTATLALAITLTLSCSGGDDGGNEPSSDSGGGISSSSDGGGGNSGIVHGTPVEYGNETYETVVIGDQTWMARNLNYDPWCYDNDPANCTKYGGLYLWAEAMDLDESCINSSCASQIQAKHRGICPSGWHIPSNADWDKLFRFVDGTSGTESPYYSSTAGTKLKAISGWNNCGPSGSGKSYLCEDAYGFAALPGGGLWTGGSGYRFVGIGGYWWSASERAANSAYVLGIDDNSERVDGGYNEKYNGHSVRCLKDNN